MNLILFNPLIFCRKTVLLFCFCLFLSTLAFAQPTNDNCSNAKSRVSSTTCSNNTNTLNNATASAGIPGVPCVAGVHYDVWFVFTALNTSHTATISNRGSNFTNPEVAIFSGPCGATLVQQACGTTTTTANGLIIGNVYYVRVSNVGAAMASNGSFDICITHPPPPPVNDDCSGAISRTSSTSCNNNGYDMRYATASAGIPGVPCVAGVHYDIWFSFIAVGSTETATISSRGSSFTNPEVAIFSGPCGATLVQQACGTTTATATGLTIGATYYVRISNVGAAITSNNGQFDICITHPNTPVNDLCTGSILLTSASTCNTITSNLRYATSLGPAGSCGGATLATTFDVWFRFQATSTMHSVYLSNLGSNLTAATTYTEVLSGACGALTSLSCQSAATRDTVAGLIIGNFYFVRVYVLSSPTAATTSGWNFDICVQQPPVNDLCANAVTLTPGVACTNITGTLDLATPTVLAAANGCALPGTYFDVWYRFTATALSHTITLSAVGANFTAPRIIIYPACGAVPIGCTNTLSITQATVIGTTYYVQIANFGVNPWTTTTGANFNICVTTVGAPPGNDNCSGAVLLTSGTVCSNTAGTLLNATATAGLPACGNAASPDVWYSFVAQSAYPIITLNAVGANLATAQPRIQLFSGLCGTLTSLACTASPLITGNVPLTLTIGTTYYVRITTLNLPVPWPAGTYNYAICITDPVPLARTIIDYAKSYINVTSGTTGGTINPGDILEIRATLAVLGGALRVIDSVAFYDTLKAGIGLSLLPNNLATRTNEGVIYKTFTDANADADAGFVTPVGADNAIQINIGAGATKTVRGKLQGSSRPSFYNNTCIIMATYRVTVTGGYGTKINFGGGALTYKDPVSGNSLKINFPTDSLMVYQSAGSCPNNLGQTNILGDEFNGTFGVPPGPLGAPQNRTASLSTNYAYAVFAANAPQDYLHGVANNTSANNTIVQTVAKPGGAARVFGHWDITGDHTGAANTAKGNAPCNTAAPISASNPCGYMLVINSAYRTDRAFTFTVSGACPNTYYEISSWLKNICYRCGCDSMGRGSGTAGYIPSVVGPAGFGDSSGVRPNLAFQINNIDYYTTGDIPYQGLGIGATQAASDTMNRWLRKAFVYKTGITETGFTISIRNNAPGGGGNDWAIDDISLKTCYPSMSYSPSINPNICANGTITIRDTVRSLYNTYVEYKWQRSTNGGVTWVDIAGTTATASPIVVNGMYQFITTYTVPPVWTSFTNNGDQYRVVVATTVANLASTCNFSDVIPITIIINNCIDIDDDNDGIPDYVEFNNPVALQDANLNGIPNWNDPTYAGFVDNNLDSLNDNFDFGADSDNDGIPNYLDPTFLPWVDTNSDGVNDLSDKDLDGIPNQLDLDSDNDGIPDVAESYGVDTNGDGIIDNYVDTDGDGFSQNVDFNNAGVNLSGNGLGAPDFDADGIPNYLDTDSDNDGIPDLVEASGADTNNNGQIDVFVDANFDGISDNSILASALLLTGVDILPAIPDGRADNWPNKNLDRDFRPNAYDVDSDGDGIIDVIEAGLPDVDLNGIVDGVIGTNGWSTTVSGFAALNLRTTDGDGKPDYLDNDSDNDGIPDNIEGQSTANYQLPTLTDADGDGLMLPYDNRPLVGSAFGGSGIFVYDHDLDGTPDYRDLDTDADGLADIVEGNDFNLNGLADDNVTLTGLDTDGDGLDNRFDSLNSVTNIKGTSYRMGNLGSFTGDATPGSRTPVQRTLVSQTDRDWRYSSYVLPVEILNFTGISQKNLVPLKWVIIASKEIDHFEVERSLTNTAYYKVGVITDPVKLHEEQNFGFTDDITGISNDIIYYRLKVIGKSGEIKYSNILIIRKTPTHIPVTIMPNPANNHVSVTVYTEVNTQATITLLDKLGSTVLVQKHNLTKGYNNVNLSLDKFSEGVYALLIDTPFEKIVKQLIIVR